MSPQNAEHRKSNARFQAGKDPLSLVRLPTHMQMHIEESEEWGHYMKVPADQVTIEQLAAPAGIPPTMCQVPKYNLQTNGEKEAAVYKHTLSVTALPHFNMKPKPVRVTGALNVFHAVTEKPTGHIPKQPLKFNAKAVMPHMAVLPQQQETVLLNHPLPEKIMKHDFRVTPVTNMRFQPSHLIIVPRTGPHNIGNHDVGVVRVGATVLPIDYQTHQLQVNMASN